MVKAIVDDLIDFGSVRRAVLGITMSPITEEIAKDLKLSSLSGVYINEVSKGSAADKAGLKKGDIIVSINSAAVKSPAEVQAKVGSFHPGDKAVITVVRDGKKQDFEVTFQASAEQTGTVADDGSVAFYGARLKTPEKEHLEALGLKNGVEIVSLGAGKVLNAGGSEGFIILYVNDEPVSKPEDVINIAKKAKRSIFIQGVTASGRESYFGFGKD
jgi:S1-C subfamily serine protease